MGLKFKAKSKTSEDRRGKKIKEREIEFSVETPTLLQIFESLLQL